MSQGSHEHYGSKEDSTYPSEEQTKYPSKDQEQNEDHKSDAKSNVQSRPTRGAVRFGGPATGEQRSSASQASQ